MQAATMTGDLAMTGTATAGRAGSLRTWARRIAIAAFLVIGTVVTLMILDQAGALAVYGLPAPFIRRRTVRVEANAPVPERAPARAAAPAYCLS